MERSTVALILLYISAVSVSSGQPVLLDSAEGETVTFHTAVRNMQILLYNGDVIGDVTDGKVKPTRIERFKGRVHWNSSTEFFSITDLKMDDSGKYKAQSDDGRAVSEFQLTVHTPVSKPDVLQEEDHCTLRCSVERGTGVTLSWRRVDGQVLNRPSPKNAPVSQLVTVTEGTYICEAKNPVSTERDSITMGKDCKIVVSKPIIKQKEGPCSLECSVRSGTEVTLSWYREGHGEILASGFSHTSPSYQLLKPKQGGNYICEAKNSISNQTTLFTVGENCRDSSDGNVVAIVGSTVGGVLGVAIVVAAAIAFHRRQQRNTDVV